MTKRINLICFLFPLFLVTSLLLNSLPLYSQEGVPETNFSGVVGSGARALSMGGAFSAIADDATAVSWNPAGLAQLEKPEFSLVLRNQFYRNLIPACNIENGDYSGPLDFRGSSRSFDFASFTYPLRLKSIKIVPQISYQRAINYDQVNNESNIYNYTPIFSMQTPNLTQLVNEQHLEKYTGGVDTLSFSLATTFFKRFHFGVSANIWLNGFEGEELINNDWSIQQQNTQEIRESGNYTVQTNNKINVKGLNFNLGILIQPIDEIKIGAVYRTAFSATLDYESSFAISGDIPVTVPNIQYHHVDLNIAHNDTSRLSWPETWGIGIAVSPVEPLTLSVDFTTTMWSKSILTHSVDFERSLASGELVFVDTAFPSLSHKEGQPALQLDTQQIRLGLEYIFFSKNFIIPVRFGFFSDSQFYPDVSGEKVTFFGVTTGFGIKRGHLAIDLAAQYEFGSYIKTPFHYAANRFEELKLYISTIYRF